MKSIGNFRGSNSSNGRSSLLCTGSGNGNEDGMARKSVRETSSNARELESFAVSKRIVRSFSIKLKKNEEDQKHQRRVSFQCLGLLLGKGGGCKVGADTCDDIGYVNGRRKSSVGEDCMAYRTVSGVEEARVDCFWRRNSRKLKEMESEASSDCVQLSLPDDVLEMCLVRVSLTTLMTSRLVCKKWRSLTTTQHFIEKRREGLYQTPWLFVFGLVRNGYCSGEIHALDVAVAQWHRRDAEILKGMFHFSVARIGNDIFVAGGCSSLASFGMFDKSSVKTHKDLLIFSPLNGSWRRLASMRVARSRPILGVLEVSSGCSIFRCHNDRQDRQYSRARSNGISDVYEDPHRFSLRRQLRFPSNESDAALSESRRKPFKFIKQEDGPSSGKGSRRLILIAVGGRGSWDEALDSGEIYDPLSDRWMDIARLPEEFGVACSGSVCENIFYVCSETGKLAFYDLERGVWAVVQTAHSPPHLLEYHPKLVACKGRLFMISVSWCERDGQTSWREEAVRKLWELDQTYITWNEVSRHPDAPLDSNAVFVADGSRIFGIEMFKIFCQPLDFVTVCDMADSELKWSHISRKHLAHEADASSCMTKSMALMHL